ncbi:MAG: hypothetical protein Q4F65_12675 [Propionibacteriaceae bacterium]|nr:hypothetical protein [Propionibacteriaceae bacterium]
MLNPTTPQAARRLQLVVLAMIGVLAGLLLLLTVLLLTSVDSRLRVFPLVFLVMFAMIGVLLWQLIPLLAESKRHFAPDGGHWCMCTDCDRTGTAVGPQSRPRMGSAPAFNRRSGIAMAILGVLIIVVFALVCWLLSNLWPVAGVVVVGALGLLVSIGCAAFAVVKLRQARIGAQLPPHHGCTCRWCGAPSRPTAAPSPRRQ